MAIAVRITPPTEMPVSLVEAKAHCNVVEDDWDGVLTDLIAAAVDEIDGPHGMLGKCMVTQTWRQNFDSFDGCLRLTVGPVSSITSITYYDTDNAEQTISADVYDLRFDDIGAFLDLNPDQKWPTGYNRWDAASVTFVAGVPVDEVPASLKVSLKMLVAQRFANREGTEGMPAAARQLIGLRRDVFV